MAGQRVLIEVAKKQARNLAELRGPGKGDLDQGRTGRGPSPLAAGATRGIHVEDVEGTRASTDGVVGKLVNHLVPRRHGVGAQRASLVTQDRYWLVPRHPAAKAPRGRAEARALSAATAPPRGSWTGQVRPKWR